jgi:O-acetyl-ADP-ribose deacetylase (regulator of RNase III)
MIKIKTCIGNLLDVKAGWISHGCNAHGIMGSGVAAAVKRMYPAAYKHYREEYEDIGLRLGEINVYQVSDNLMIVNAITQENFGSVRKRYVSYDAIQECFERINFRMKDGLVPKELHIPRLGAARGGGSWNIIEAIIEDTMNYPVTLWLPDDTVDTL